LLPAPPKVDQTYLVADYVEYCCLLTEDGFFSAAEAEADRAREEELDPSLEERMSGRDDIVRSIAGVSLEEHVEGAALEALGGEGEDPRSTAAPLAPGAGEDPTEALAADVRAILTQDVKDQLIFRARVLGQIYPFKVDPSTGSLEVRKLTKRRLIYMFLLAASRLSSFTKRQEAKLTRAFECLSVPVMRAHIPGAEVHLFGTSGSSKRGRYRGSLAKKVELLAADLRIIKIVDEQQIAPTNVGDQGIDTVVWLPTNDDAVTCIAIFVQCACSRDEWPRKALDVGEDAFRHWFHFYSGVTSVLMIPFCFRDSSGSWYDTTKMKSGVLFDRLRILLALDRDSTNQWTAAQKSFR
jgi:hypothetical protein